MTMVQVGLPASSQRTREANEWFEEHATGRELSPVELQDWDRWRADADNMAEYVETARLELQLHNLPRPAIPSAAELKADSFQVPHDDSTDSGSVVSLVRCVFRLRVSMQFFRTACVVVLCCTCAFFLAQYIRSQFNLLRASGEVYATLFGEQRKLLLEDGSVVTLTGGTVLRAHFPAQPRVAVLEQGEALFEVARDPKHPFRVFAGSGSIKAVGTQFDVRRYSTRIHVTVTEGAVEVLPRARRIPGVAIDDGPSGNGTQSAPIRVEGGQEMTYGVDGHSEPQPIDPDQALARRQGFFIYKQTPLCEVIEDIQRYVPRRITLDTAAAELQYTGTVKQKFTDQWLQNLPTVLPVEVLDMEPDSILIRSRQEVR